ncbi:FAD/NAD(P)-binding domain-containing protein [Parathielavia hyrcaniae]|uniref:FAD/NAD(P)-binding domain-containing protein n=1 Tax=Parathielavia hyrcaniae TaxID=113614 RepID=A0AAN6PT63_9PEZI|nr:FAD/NAD(P)-binding domain-containing protein [Parathielavia hyrcaniae]
MEAETFDCVVVGAGWYGLGAAKQYHFTHPSDSLVVLDGQETLGGTWAAERLYPGLKSNNLWGTYEYPDFPMATARFGVKEGSHVPGTVVHSYLKAYAAEFGIADRIRLRTRVLSAEHQDGAEGGWLLTISSDSTAEQRVFARRLIVATGQTSDAFLPHFDGEESFGGRIFHAKHFPQNRDTLQTAKSAVVLGGTKFAWDAAYAYATAGVEAHMVIRSSGHGPVWMSPTHVTPLKKWIEKLANTRLLTWFSPCVWGEADGYPGIRNFLHGTALGRKIVDSFWGILGNDVLTLNKFDSHPEVAKLKPWLDAMFVATSFSLLNYETDFFQLVKDGKIRVHISDITGLSPGKVHLSDSTQLSADVLLAVTGWKQVPPLKFLPEGIERELGVPHSLADAKPTLEDLASQQDLLDEADAQILARFPRLRREPVWNEDYVPLTKQRGVHSADAVTPSTPLTSFMLYRFMVPPSARLLRARDVAFVGFVSNFSNIITAHLQGLWVGAYFDGALVPDRAPAPERAEALRRETVLHNRFGRWRYPVDWGCCKVPSFIFDAVPYLDMLQRDLGIDHRRKPGVLAQVFGSYGPEDYRSVNEEWAAARGVAEPVAS